MKKCLIIHSSFNHLGGAEILSLRMVKSLIKTGYSVDILHVGNEINFTQVNDWSDLELNVDCIHEISYFLKRNLNAVFLNKKASLLRYSIALRLANLYKNKYDKVISTYGELPLNGIEDRGFQFIHAPIFGIRNNQLEFLGFNDSGSIKVFLRKLYVKVCRLIAGWSVEKIEIHTALANSKWSAEQVRDLYPDINIVHSYIGANTKNIFSYESLGDWWTKRDDSIVILGRVARGKNVELALEFLNRLNANGYNLKLVIIGSPESPEYEIELQGLINGNPSVIWYRGLTREKLELVVSKCKWGLHCSKFEHYGLSAIELQRLGCITFVPNYCGQAEIMDYELLKYNNLNDLVSKFSTVLSNKSGELDCANSSRVKLISEHTVEKHDERVVDIFS